MSDFFQRITRVIALGISDLYNGSKKGYKPFQFFHIRYISFHRVCQSVFQHKFGRMI